MTRIVAREIAVHLLFELNFGGRTAEQVLEGSLTRERFQTLAEEDPLYREFPNEKQLRYIRELVQGAYDHRPELDEAISRYAIGWSFSRLSRMAVAAMRCAMYELRYMPQIPRAASINAALEIVKKYEEPEVVSFVNGILGTFVRTELPQESEPGCEETDGEETGAVDAPAAAGTEEGQG